MATAAATKSNSSISAGCGLLHLALLPPSRLTIQDIAFSYPLKLIAPRSSHSLLAQLVFILSYGGGLVGGDRIHLVVQIDDEARLAAATQGSTKIFEAQIHDQWTEQRIEFTIKRNAGLILLPDPLQPFKDSRFRQHQTFEYSYDADLVVLDWVSEGRTTAGEHWSFHDFRSLNEFWLVNMENMKQRRLMLRDHMILDNVKDTHSRSAIPVASRMHGVGIFATLFIWGPRMEKLKGFLIEEFRLLPRIGQRRWLPPAPEEEPKKSQDDLWRDARLAHEQMDGILWTASVARGFTIVKLTARSPEGARLWFNSMLVHEGSIEQVFGSESMYCLNH